MTQPTDFIEYLQHPVWLLDDTDELVIKSQGALQFEKSYQFSLQKIIEISQGKGCALHATQEICLNCPIEKNWDKNGIPLVLLDNEENSCAFWVRLEKVDQYKMLQINPEEKGQKNTENHVMFSYLNEVRENERKKIAQELHDGIAQSIYSLMLETRGLKWLEGKPQLERISQIDQHFTEVLQEVRQLATDMSPIMLEDLGLLPSLEHFIEQTLLMTGFQIDMAIEGMPKKLTDKENLVIFRIIQESIANAMKYSMVNEANITVTYIENFVQVTITDKGEGFILEKQQLGLGLLNMKERALSIGGSLLISSEPSNGTSIQLTIPKAGESL